MALNWFLTIKNMSRTDAKALEIFELLKKAETDEEKENAKRIAQEYVAQTQNSEDNTSKPTEETNVVEENQEPVDEPVSVPDTDNTVSDADNIVQESAERDEEKIKQDLSQLAFNPPEETNVVEENQEPVDEPVSVPDTDNTVSDADNIVQESAERDEEKIKQDLSQLAFNPRLAKCGITREEELFLNHVFVRKLSHEEKILMRRSIYQKKTQRNAQIQAEFKAKRIAQKKKDLSDPEKIKYHQERKYIAAVVDALENHRNLGWIFSQIEGLTPDILRDLVKKPENKSAIEQVSTEFFDRFNKKYGA